MQEVMQSLSFIVGGYCCLGDTNSAGCFMLRAESMLPRRANLHREHQCIHASNSSLQSAIRAHAPLPYAPATTNHCSYCVSKTRNQLLVQAAFLRASSNHTFGYQEIAASVSTKPVDVDGHVVTSLHIFELICRIQNQLQTKYRARRGHKQGKGNYGGDAVAADQIADLHSSLPAVLNFAEFWKALRGTVMGLICK